MSCRQWLWSEWK